MSIRLSEQTTQRRSRQRAKDASTGSDVLAAVMLTYVQSAGVVVVALAVERAVRVALALVRDAVAVGLAARVVGAIAVSQAAAFNCITNAALAVVRIALAVLVANVASRASDGVQTLALTVVALVHGRAGVVVVARSAVELLRVGAHTGALVALTNIVALVERSANHSSAGLADTESVAGILSALVIVEVARAVLRLVGVAASTSVGVASAGQLALVGRVAAVQWGVGHALAVDASIMRSAQGAVGIARSTVLQRWVGALAGGRVADTSVVALIQRSAHHSVRVHAVARCRIARISSARVAVIAVLVGVVAAGGRIARVVSASETVVAVVGSVLAAQDGVA